MTRKRKILISISVFVVLILGTITYCDRQVEAASQKNIYSDINKIPHNNVGLLLGTGKYLAGGYINPYYKYRIDAAAQLIKSGKITYLVISGDNSRKDYDEPNMMKADLIAKGIDSSCLYLDFAGFRTFDSMIRLRKIFSQDSVTVISQEFHNQRAIFIAKNEGIAAIGFNAKDVSNRNGLRTKVREKFARSKVFLDYLFNNEPRFLGPKVNIPKP